MANGYGKRPLWQWILIYVVIGGVIYGLIYYFVIAKKGGYSYNSSSPSQTVAQPSTAPAMTGSQTAPSTTSSQNAVQIKNMSFSPATLTVKVGDKVTWTNQDSIGHSATAGDNSFDTGVLSTGQSGSASFNKAGTYTYHCSVHPTMKGTIVVQ